MYKAIQFSINLNAVCIIYYQIHVIETLNILGIGNSRSSIFNYNMQLVAYKILFLYLFIRFIDKQK